MKILPKLSLLSLIVVLVVGACDQGTISAPDGPEGLNVATAMVPGAAGSIPERLRARREPQVPEQR